MKIRNTFNTRSLPLSAMAVMASVVGFAASANAATLTKGEFQIIGDVSTTANTVGISVTSGSEGYSTGTDGYNTGGLDGTFNGSILDYGFYTSGTGSLVESFGGAASRINLPTIPGGSTSNDAVNINIWAGSATTGAADQLTYSKPVDVSGTVDIAGLTSGSLYMFFGARNIGDLYAVTFTLSGGGQPVVPMLSEIAIESSATAGVGTLGTTANNSFFVYRADFADAAGYDTLTYTYDQTNGNSAARARFGGVVLTAPVPEPSTALLGALGVLFLLRRRRI